MNKYNLFVLLPNNTEDQMSAISKKIVELLEKKSVKIIAEDRLGKRKLAFPIKKVRHAFYSNFIIDVENIGQDELQKIWREMRLMPDILRFEVSRFIDQKGSAPKLVYSEEDGQRSNYSFNETEKKEMAVAEQKIEEKKPEMAVNQNLIESEDTKNSKKESKISMEELDQKLDDILFVNDNI